MTMDYEGKVSRLAEAAAVEVHRRAVRKLGEALAEVRGSRPPGMMSAFPVYLRVDEIEALHAHATESRSVDGALADELAAIHDTLGRGLARRFSATTDEAQRALGAIVDRLRGEYTDCGSVTGEKA